MIDNGIIAGNEAVVNALRGAMACVREAFLVLDNQLAEIYTGAARKARNGESFSDEMRQAAAIHNQIDSLLSVIKILANKTKGEYDQ